MAKKKKLEFENLEIDLVKGISLGIEYENDDVIYGDPNTHYFLIDLFILRFCFTVKYK
jgi:hypothetical protein